MSSRGWEMGWDSDISSREDIKTQMNEKLYKGVVLNENWNVEANKISKGDHVVYLIKGNNFIDKKNAAFLIYFDFS